MPRPKKFRVVSAYPPISRFAPEGGASNGQLSLTMEELEAIRLSDFEHLDQETAAQLMQVSRQTYGRILAAARSIVGEALVAGKALKIEGGTFEMRGRGWRHRQRCGQGGRAANRVQGGEQMPRGDGTGPDGKGPAGGRGKGPCGRNQPSSGGGGAGRGSGQGRGRRGGRGRGQGQGGQRSGNGTSDTESR